MSLPTIERHTDSGTETLPLSFLFAEVAVPILFIEGIMGEQSAGEATWERSWRPRYAIPNQDGYWAPEITARRGWFLIRTTRSRLHVYLSGTTKPLCHAIGDTPLESDLQRLLVAWSQLPQGVAVSQAILDRYDWLDRNPMFRRIPVKQSKTIARKQGVRD